MAIDISGVQDPYNADLLQALLERRTAADRARDLQTPSGGRELQTNASRRRLAELQALSEQPVRSGIGALTSILASGKAEAEAEKIQQAENESRQRLAEMLAQGDQNKAAIYSQMPQENLLNALMDSTKSKGPMTVKSGEALVDPETYQPLYTNNKPFEPKAISPGGALVDSEGNPLYQAPHRPQRPTVLAPGAIAYDENGNVLGEGNPVQPKLPAGYQMGAEGKLEPMPGGPIDQQMQEKMAALDAGITQAESTLKEVDALLNHDGFTDSVGLKGLSAKGWGILPFVDDAPMSGTAAADWKARYDQLQGKGFLAAFETLKGGGQITQIEGEKAQNAINRMNTAQSEEDFILAARDFQSAVRIGIEKLKAQGGRGQQPQIDTGRIQQIQKTFTPEQIQQELMRRRGGQ